MPMSTVHIHSGLPLLPTIEHDNGILIWSLLSQWVAVTVSITKTLSYSSSRSLKEKGSRDLKSRWCHILSATNTDNHKTEDFIRNNHPEQQFLGPLVWAEWSASGYYLFSGLSAPVRTRGNCSS